ncbi:response regulator [Pararhodobacter marinus]|uniref:response regulator n=1 Tax=Pararhodobacter marinus TaxID=2184063 RepID=UPI003518DE76
MQPRNRYDSDSDWQPASLTMLVVDDDEIACELLKAGLGAFGNYKVESVNSAAEAMEAITRRTRPYDCFFLDIEMPGGSGIELCSWIKSHEQYRETPAIMVTARSERAFIRDAFAAGAIDYITKPFDMAELRSRAQMAERLIAATRETGSASANGPARQSVGFDEAIVIEGIPGVIDYVAMKNYLKQLSRSRLFSTALVAFRLDGLNHAYGRLSAREFRALLTLATRKLKQAIGHPDALIAYAGEGCFIAELESVTGLDGADIARKASLALWNAGFPGSFDCTTTAFQGGTPQRIGVLFSHGAVDRSLDVAFASVHHHVDRLRAIPANDSRWSIA